MTITRVNPTGWKTRDELTHDSMNQIDTNITYGLDKRDGYVDTLSSAITVTGSAEFQTGSFITLDNPSVFQVIDDSSPLYIGAEIRGDTRGSANDPLRLGYQSVPVISTSQTLTASQMTTQVMTLTGILSNNTVLTLPAISGYAKIVDNQTTVDGYSLSLVATGSSNPLLLSSGASWIYCDGTDLIFGPHRTPLQVVDFNSQNDGYSFSTPNYQSTSSSSLIKVTNGSSIYSNDFSCNLGDILEIFYTANSKPSATVSSYIEILVQITKPDASVNPLNETIFINENTGTAYPANASFNTLYTCVATGTHTVALYVKSTSGTATVLVPLVFTIKQVRP